MSRLIGKSNSPASGIKIRNVGPKSQAWLRQVGIRTTEEIRSLGAFEAFLKVRRGGFKASLNLVYALAGAEDDVHWQDLLPERKAELLQRYTAFEAEQKAQKKIFRPRSELGASLVAKALGSSEPSGSDDT
jgi:DNA transformation protein and related proteins